MPKTNTEKNQKKREVSLDILRGIAVFLMVLAHTIAFTHTQENALLNLLQNFGDTICFTTFLFVSGASTYLAYLQVTKKDWKMKRKSLFKRLFKLLTGYYLVAIISSFGTFTTQPSTWIKNILHILLFIKVPGYTEFLLPFFFFGLLIIIFRSIFIKLSGQKYITLLIIVLAYLLGYLLHNLPVSSPLVYYKALLVGEADWYRFPLLQYSGVFLIGILFGRFLVKEASYKQKQNNILILILSTLLLFLLALGIEQFLHFPYTELLQRWPPSISFIAFGLSFVFFLLLIIRTKIKDLTLTPLKDILSFFGRYAFGIYMSHIVILQLENLVFTIRTSSVWKVFLCFILLILTSALSILTAKYLFQKKKRRRAVPKPYYVERSRVRMRKTKPNSIVKDKYFLLTVTIMLVSAIGFVKGIGYLSRTFANHSNSDQLSNVQGGENPEVRGEYIQDETKPGIYSHSNRQWVLKGAKTNPNLSILVYTVEITGPTEPESFPRYEIDGVTTTGRMEKISEKTYQAKIEADSLIPGTYKIQASATIEGAKHTTEKYTFYVSYPLYVVWSMDWEGYDVPDEELQKMADFSYEHYDLPITHFFNPRIYVTSEISSERADHLTMWVQSRQINGDEIGLHLHMNYDMVEATGVQVRKEPKWTNYMTNGQDVPCSEYTYYEFMQILAWAKNQFAIHGLEEPKSFRAGGWFADLETLQALDNSGFLIDSSGRNYYVWGTEGNKIAGYWNLESTTRPYQPSKSNQSASTPAPNFNLWEFPNNGNDSWFYKSEDLISRFNDNYKRKPLEQSQTLTYLSHPHQLHKDIEELEPTFAEIDQHLAIMDKGPVVYTTLEEAYENITGQ